MTLSWRYAAASDVGLLRDGNEDAAFAGQRLLAVADGMGGHAAGEVASAAAIAALERLDATADGDPSEALRSAVQEANRRLRDMAADDAGLHGMGTTVTAVLNDGDYAWLAHVGDSRAYLMRDGVLRQLTHDHTYVQQLVDEGRLAPEDVNTHPQRALITRALDGREDMQLDLDRVDVEPGDRLLLCSDGLTGVVTDETMANVLTGTTPEDAVRRLVDLALRGGAPDNVTCIVADVVDDTNDSGHLTLGATTAEPPAAPAAAPTVAPADPIERDGPDPRERSRALRRRRLLVTAVVTVLVLAVGARAGYAWTQTQYYVGADGNQVVIYKGVEGTLAGIDLSHVAERPALPLDSLPEFERRRVQDGIHAKSRADAQGIVARLRQAVTP